MAQGREKDSETESRRIIARVSQESDPAGVLQRTSKRVQDHLSATDSDVTDKIEVWGTRIGRLIAAAFTVLVIAWALYYLMRR